MEYNKTKALIMNEISNSLDDVDASQVDTLLNYIVSSEKVFVVGVGRVLLMLEAFVKRLNHLGIDSFFVGIINEPAITDKDLLIVGSGSGELIFPLSIARKAKSLGIRIVHIGSNENSSVSELADLVVRIPCQTKLNLSDEIKSNQPMSSLFEQCLLLFLDIVSMMLIDRQKIDINKLWRKHANLE